MNDEPKQRGYDWMKWYTGTTGASISEAYAMMWSDEKVSYFTQSDDDTDSS